MDVGKAVSATVRSSIQLAESCGVQVTVAPSREPTVAQVSQETIQRILAPVLENVLVYPRSKVEVAFARIGGRASITITDDGPGIPESERESAFEPGRRGGAPRNAAAPTGTGLGLSLSRRLARATGGEVMVAGPPKGNRMVVTLQLALDQVRGRPRESGESGPAW